MYICNVRQKVSQLIITNLFYAKDGWGISPLTFCFPTILFCFEMKTNKDKNVEIQNNQKKETFENITSYMSRKRYDKSRKVLIDGVDIDVEDSYFVS